MEESIRTSQPLIYPFEVSGIIKVLTNKSKIIQAWVVQNMAELFEKAQLYYISQANRDQFGNFRGVHKEMTLQDLIFVTNGIYREELKL